MALKCKPGDLAIILNSARYPEVIGRIVEVLYTAPQGDFDMPDGFPAWGASPGGWVIKLIGAPIFEIELARHRVFGWIEDFRLCPISGPTEEIEQDVGSEVEAVA